jgi:2-dehydropantoate 2-reductase
MKVCIVGAGAIGGFIGTRLAAARRCEVCALARGAALAALRAHGWRLRQAGWMLQAPARAAESAAELGAQDCVVVAVKGPALDALAPTLAPLIGPETIVLPAMNGVPWWFCDGLPGFDEPLASVDPGGAISRAIARRHVVGCVVHASASTPEPGLVHHKMGQGLIVGEPGGGRSERAQRIVELLADAGFEATHSADVRYEIWYKLWGNLTMNPISAITGATVDRVLADPLLREFCSAAMRECAAVGERIGCQVLQTPEQRHAVTAKLGAFKTSMQQDVEAGRAIELDAIVAAVQEIGGRLGLATPNIDVLFGLTRLFARTRGLYPEAG